MTATGRRRTARAGTAVQMAEGDAALGQIVRRHFQGDLVAGQNTDVVLAHLSAAVGSDGMSVFQGPAETGIREDFRHGSMHYEQFLFSHCGVLR